MDDETYQEIIQKKCPYCFVQRGNFCIMTPYGRAVMCYGPFKDLQDRLEKTRDNDEDGKKGLAQFEMKRHIKETKLDDYLINKMLFESRDKKDSPDGDDDK